MKPIDKVQRTVMQLTAALEGVDIEDYDLDGSYAQMVILDLYEDLGEHQGWIDKTVMAIRRHLDQAEVIEKIRKLREDTNGRTPAEIAAFRAAADRLERLRVWGEIGQGTTRRQLDLLAVGERESRLRAALARLAHVCG